jgi:capsular exopolysaccharide synthesis family protein
MMEMQEPRAFHLTHYLNVVQKRLWVVLAVVVVATSATYYRVSRQIDQYRATARIQIDREAPKVLQFQEVVDAQAGMYGDEYFQTMFQLIQSRSLAEEVIRRLNLASNPEFLGSKQFPKTGIRGFLAQLFGGQAKKEVAAPPVASPTVPQNTMLVNRFLGMLRIDLVKNTRLMDVNVISPYPRLAADMANALCVAFIERNQEQRLSTTRQATDWLSTQIDDARRKVEESEVALQKFREGKDIVAIENREAIVGQKLEELNTAYTRAKTDRIALETRYRQMQKMAGAELDSLPDVMSNPTISQLRAERARLSNELADQEKTYTPKHPRIIKLRAQLDSVQQQIQLEISKVVKSIRNEYEVAKAKEETIQQAFDQQKKSVQSMGKSTAQISVLERDVENNRKIYSLLLSRAKETGLSEGLQTGNLHIVDKAEVPLGPFAPNRRRALMFSFALSLLGGLTLVFFMEYMDDSVKDPDDLEAAGKLPFLASIPYIRMRENDGVRELVTQVEPKSSFAEAYRSARTSILFAADQTPLNTLLVTSAGPREGKTTTAVNLAVTLAQAGNRVLLIDADLRKPRVHSVFSMENTTGLSKLLTESNDISDMCRKTVVPNLNVITSGPIPANPAELLASPRMKKLLAALEKSFDRVIVDCPPVISVTDASIISALVDGVVLVIGAGKTSRKVTILVKNRLDEAKAKLLGVVMNFVDNRRGHYYYAAPHYYYSYYGSEGGSNRKKKGRRKH